MQTHLRRALCVATVGLCGVAMAPPIHGNADSLTQFDYRSLAAHSDVTDSLGHVWHHRAGLTGNNFSTLLSNATINATTEPELYRSNAYGDLTYTIPVPAAAQYTVTVYAAEDFFHQSGKRVFDVSAEGSVKLNDVDLYQQAGFATAWKKSFTVDVTDGTLNMTMDSVVDNPLVSAVEVTYAGPASTTSNTNTSDTSGLTPTSSITQSSGDTTHAVGFSSKSFWFQDISSAPLADNTAAQASSLASQVSKYYGGVAAFNAHEYNVAMYTADSGTAKTDVTWVDCQNKGSVPADIYTGKAYFKSVPIPSGAVPASGTDGEISIYSASTDQLWEFWQAKQVSGKWQACWGGRIDNVSSNLGMFAEGYGVAATNVALSGGMITLADVKRGYINHAMSLVIMDPASYTKFSWPAQRSDGSATGGGLILEGTRLRLDPSLDLSKYNLTPIGLMVAKAAQKYGFVISDKGGAVSVSTESGTAQEKQTGTNPWDTLENGLHDYQVMANFPWDKTQFLPTNYGKP